MLPRKTPETQMNLMFCDGKPMMLPDDKKREPAIALVDCFCHFVAILRRTSVYFQLKGFADLA